MQELCAANSGFEDSSMYPPASGANNIMHHVVSVGFVLAAEPISGRFDAIYLLEILMPEPAADKGQKPLFHSPIHCSPPFRNSGVVVDKIFIPLFNTAPIQSEVQRYLIEREPSNTHFVHLFRRYITSMRICSVTFPSVVCRYCLPNGISRWFSPFIVSRNMYLRFNTRNIYRSIIHFVTVNVVKMVIASSSSNEIQTYKTVDVNFISTD